MGGNPKYSLVFYTDIGWAIHQNRTMPLGTLLEVRYPEPLEVLTTHAHIEPVRAPSRKVGSIP